MKRKEYIYFGLIAAVLILLLLLRAGNAPLNWTKTYSRFDKNPYGSYALHELIGSLFPGSAVSGSNQTIYEITSQLDSGANVLVIADRFWPDDESLKSMLRGVSDGAHYMISAKDVSADLLDTLEVEMGYEQLAVAQYFESKDSIFISVEGAGTYHYNPIEFSEYFEEYPEGTELLGTNENQHAVAISIPFGRGRVTLCTTPIVFTNFFMLYEQNHEAASTLLRALPMDDLYWTEYYQVGKLNSSSPLRAVLRYPALKLALYMTLGLIVIYLLFGSKRKQRIIPIIRRLPNQTVQFVKTVGMLYFHSGDHKAMMMNRVHYLKEYLVNRLNIKWNDDDQTVHRLAAKTNLEIDRIRTLFDYVKRIESAHDLTVDEMLRYNKALDYFYTKRK